VTETPRFQMLGEADALVCEDGVCALPDTEVGSGATE
jgi:hypothetical protein